MNNVKKNLENALNRICKKYKFKINKFYYNEDINDYDNDTYNIIEIEGTLPNGNKIEINTYQFADCDLNNEHSIYNLLEEYIQNALITKYEGTISPDDCGFGFCVGEEDMMDIFSRLCGRKVRIEVIE